MKHQNPMRAEPPAPRNMQWRVLAGTVACAIGTLVLYSLLQSGLLAPRTTLLLIVAGVPVTVYLTLGFRSAKRRRGRGGDPHA